MKVKQIHFKTVDSTNTWAKGHAYEFDREILTLITADEQTAGRGRFKRAWVSPAGQNIYASFCFFQKNLRQSLGNIPQILALSVVKLLDSFSFTPKLKWPNDILISGKKVGGILCETTQVDQGFFVILGIGLNINMKKESLNQIDRPATSLFVEGDKVLSVQDMIQHLVDQFSKDLELFFAKGFSVFFQKYVNSIALAPQETLIFSDQGREWKGSFDSINSDGSLTLKLEDGTFKRFVSGEIL